MKQKTSTKQNPIKMKSNKHKNKATFCAMLVEVKGTSL